jgi:hypothetical protein
MPALSFPKLDNINWFIVTRNATDFINSAVPALTPEAMLAEFASLNQ